MNDRPLVGVIVPAYNAERWLAAALRSLQAQTLADWTCVVVDDGSTDDTAAVAEKFAAGDDRITLVHQANAGVGAARNTGLAILPDCPYVAFFDADDVYLPDALERLVAALERRPDAVGAYGLADYVDRHGDVLDPGLHPARQRWRREVVGHRLRLQDNDADASFRTMAVAGPIWPPAVAVERTEKVRAVGGFDPDFMLVQDWEMFLRLTRHGPFAALDEPVALYRRQGANRSSQHDEAWYFMDRVRRKAWESPENTPEQRRCVTRAWRLLEGRQVLVLARHALRSLRRRRWRSAYEASVGVLVCAALLLRWSPPPASRRRTRWIRPDDHLDVPL
jgi:glycosyltransferase involved in cell wall biosynthesis